LILASRSPQRRAILERMGIPFEVRASEAPERAEGAPAQVALENAQRKARAVAAGAEGRPVLGVDTVVALDGRLYGQPADEAQARDTLLALAGRTHEVVSGLCLIAPSGVLDGVARTAVSFRPRDDRMLEWYLASGEWRGRAGAYAIQERGAALVQSIDGDYLNVVGLPLALLLKLAPEVLL
jgi:septum formation protein